ncbi:hypothetical protein V8C26DRAFT_27998 [Trichoderma gracile]
MIEVLFIILFLTGYRGVSISKGYETSLCPSQKTKPTKRERAHLPVFLQMAPRQERRKEQNRNEKRRQTRKKNDGTVEVSRNRSRTGRLTVLFQCEETTRLFYLLAIGDGKVVSGLSRGVCVCVAWSGVASGMRREGAVRDGVVRWDEGRRAPEGGLAQLPTSSLVSPFFFWLQQLRRGTRDDQ